MLNLDASQSAALAKASAMRRLFFWCDALTAGGAADPVGFWDDLGDIVISSRTYHGSGSLITFAALNQVADMSIPGLQVTLSGISPAAAALVRGDVISQRPVELDIGIFDVTTRAIIGALVPHFRGKVDNCQITRSADSGTATITLTCESVARALTVARRETRSQAASKERWAADTFYKYTAAQRGKKIYFGTPKGQATKSK